MGIGSNRRSRGENYLLMFAIDTYKAAPKLNNCVKDVKALKSTLTKYFFYEEDKTTCLFNKKATRRAILNSISKIRAQITEKDSLLIVYSGHGKIVNDYGYWIPVEADPKEDADFISASDITNRLEGIKCRHLFMIIDACFSGTMIKIFKSEEDKLENDELRPSRRVLTSSHNREKALDGTPGENSPFAQIIIQYLNKNKNSVIEVKDLIRFVEKEVKTQTGKQQTPQSGILAIKGHENGQLFIYPKSKLASFEYVLELIQEEKEFIQKEEQEDATNALKNFLLNYKKLPIQYAHHLSFVANRVNRWINLNENKLIIGLYKKRFERELEIELNKTVLELSKLPPPKKNKYYNILEYIALDQTKTALKILVDEVGDKEKLFPELVKLISQFHLINRDLLQYKRNNELTSPQTNENIENDYTEFILGLLFLIERLEASDEDQENQLDYIKNTFLQSDINNKKIIYLTSYLRFSPKNDQENWFLLKNLKETQENLVYNLFTNNINPIKGNEVQSKINQGFSFIIDQMLQKEDKIINDWLLQVLKEKEITQYSLIKKPSYKKFLQILLNDSVKEMLSYIMSLLPHETNDLKKNIINARKKFFQSLIPPIDSSSVRFGKTAVITDIARLAKFIAISNNNSVLNFSSLFQKIDGNDISYAIPYREVISIENLQRIKRNIAIKELQEIFDDLGNYNLSTKDRLLLEILKIRFKSNFEDELFSQKNIELINLRRNDIRKDLLELIDDLLLEKYTSMEI